MSSNNNALANEKPAIAFKDVTKVYKLYRNSKKRFMGLFNKNIKYKRVEANSHLSFTIQKGEAVAFLGHNGAGKSTCLKMITGVVYPTSGTIEINGRVSALLELTAGFDLQFTGRENIYLRGQLWGLTKSEIQELEGDVIEFSELGDYIDQPVRSYSSGMKSRLGFAFATAIKPDILVVDETLAVGDAAFRKKCITRVRSLLSGGDVTVLFVTHSKSLAQEFCTRGLVMEKGKLLFDGPIDEANAFYEARYNTATSAPASTTKK